MIEPVRSVQSLFDRHAYVTRLYTTLSAAEMTEDPLFGFNAQLPPVSNVHRAEQVIECASGVTQAEAPWRVHLPRGGIVRGTGRVWPTASPDAQPPNARILQLAESGPGSVMLDNTPEIAARLNAHNATVPGPKSEDEGCAFRSPPRASQSSTSLAVLLAAAAGAALTARRRRS